MKIKLTSVHAAEIGLLVHFHCAVGEAVALWQSKKITPLEEHEYDVELDVDAVLKLGDNATIELDLKPSLMVVDTKVQIVGIVERFDDDGMVYLRLAPDCIMMIESMGSVFHVTEALCLILEPTIIKLTPIG